MAEVPMQTTPISREALVRLICERIAAVGGGLVDHGIVAMVYGLVWMESGQGASVQNYNYGNIIALSEADPYWVAGWARDPDHPLYGVHPGEFRAYDSAEQGMDALLSLLDRRYSLALMAASRGDFDGASHELLAAGYCPDCDPATHSAGLQANAQNVLSLQIVAEQCGDFEHVAIASAVSDPMATDEAMGAAYRALGPADLTFALLAAAAPVVMLGTIGAARARGTPLTENQMIATVAISAATPLALALASAVSKRKALAS